MRVEEMLAAWAAQKLGHITAEDVKEVTFRHTDAESTGEGTYWPEDYALVHLKRGGKPIEIGIDGVEGIPGLIREVLAAGGHDA